MIIINSKALKKTKDVIIYHLRMYFANLENIQNQLPENLEASVFSHLENQVWDTEPEELRNLPLVVISGASGEMITGGLGDMAAELFNDFGELVGYRYGGMFEFNLVIEIASRTSLEREALTDIVTGALRFGIRRKMEAQGVLVKSMRYGGESTLNYNSDRIYVSTINLSTWSEWYDDFDLMPIEQVSVGYTEKE